ncbi:hypothetical protein BDY19DRAFT_942170 [Irpex rosettiformis]|uniref:Uncharacterized protein n=1 Tax=Irpex rosettiformis TaxID=378272 RepID=A0ACB8U5A0_9APHY|nr:hypothetical protein BDY19DRAFT_942170 [Irpex rosettiformis]
MVSADNLNFDCLELIVSYLAGPDLYSVTHVSRSFLTAALPLLYRTLSFNLGNGKRYPKVMSAFDTVKLHPGLAVHVHHIDIRMVPMVPMSIKMYPQFLSSLIQTLERCVNLKSLTCTPKDALPPLLAALDSLTSLEKIRINAHLTADQGNSLLSLKKLKSISLDGASWNVVDILPQWTLNLNTLLTCLTFSTVQELNEPVLRSILQNLPNLRGLHVVACPKIEHVTILQSLVHTPRLESLSFTAWDTRTIPHDMSPLPHLRHLAIDSNMGSPPVGDDGFDRSPQIWHFMLAKTRAWSCPLSSIMLKISDKITIPSSLVNELLDGHAGTLTSITLISCEFDMVSLRSVALRCTDLEKFAVRVPTRDIDVFADSLSYSHSLRLLHDVTETHVTHGAPFLNTSNVRILMELISSLTKVISYGRTWTVSFLF